MRALLITGDRRRVLRGHGPRRVDRRAGAASPGFDPRTTAEALRVGVQAFIRELWELDKPTVAAVNGAAVGPGRAPRARVRLRARPRRDPSSSGRSHKWGLVVDAGGAYLLPRLVGLPRAKAMVLLGEGATGAEAVELGLAYRCVDDAERARRRRPTSSPTRLAAGPDARARAVEAAAQRELRDRPRRRSLELEGAYQSLATASTDLVEGMAAFREKRDAKFTGS